MPYLLLGAGLLIGFLLLAKWASEVEPRDLKKALLWGGGGLIVLVALFLAVTGRLAFAGAALAMLVPWVTRALRAHAMWKMARGLFGAAGGGSDDFSDVGDRRDGASSALSTDWLDMTLDHETGALDGTLRKGAFEGRSLASLSAEERARLWRDVAGDPESRRVLASWLDRNDPDWRADFGADRSDAAESSDGAMTREEAYRVLGLDQGASADAIRAAYRRLMARMHPDAGGSDAAAARLNRAREVLLGDGR